MEEADSEFLVNDQDPNEFFFHVKGKREGSDALKNMFMPLIFAFNSLTGENVGETAPQIDVTVMGQPANRIGKGVSQLSSGSQARLAGFAALPLAISNLQFASLANPASAPLSTYTIDVLRNSSDALTPGHIKGGLVNLTAGTSGYYGDISGEKAVTDNLAKASITGVTVEVAGGVVTLKGSVAKGSKIKVMQAANEANPKPTKVVAAELTEK